MNQNSCKNKIIQAIQNLSKIHFLRYCFVGAVASVIDLTIFFSLNELVKLHYIIALIISFTIAAIFNFLLQKKITFKNTYSKKLKQFSLFFALQLIGLFLSEIITGTQVELLSIWPTLARFITIWIVLAYNYYSNKLITFKILK